MSRSLNDRSGAVRPAVVSSAIFAFNDTSEAILNAEALKVGKGRSDYARYGNPTQIATEARLAELERGESAYLTPSGMAAVTTTLKALTLAHAEPIHLVLGSEGYKKTRSFAETDLRRSGVELTFLRHEDFSDVEAHLRPNTRIIFLESPSNPYLRVVDLEKLGAIGRERGITTIVDATFATPINQRPLDLGIDLVVHSATKYLAGHNNCLAGAVIGRKEEVDRIRNWGSTIGQVTAAEVAERVYSGLDTLELRVQAMNHTAQIVAEYLESHALIERVWYPGLNSHPDHGLAKQQLSGFGGVISFWVKGDLADTGFFIDSLKLPYNSPSFGGPEPLIEQPTILSYWKDYTAEDRSRLGIPDKLVRFHIGLEKPERLIDDLESAFVRLSEARISYTQFAADLEALKGLVAKTKPER